MWVIVERELVRQSRFFSLIDIYGHYANRGDTVVIRTTVRGGNRQLARAINYLGSSAHCGLPVAISDASAAMEVAVGALPQWIDRLRSLRWDIRVKQTHPTLAADSVLVTYPFPALSEKAHFDKGSAAARIETDYAGDVAV